MLVRAYRLTDKLGVAALKSSIALVDATLDGLSIIWGVIASILLLILRVVWFLLRPFALLFGGIVMFLVNRVRLMVSGGAASGPMARRATAGALDAGLAEDPLRVQNRVLSGMTVILLLFLIGTLLWASSPTLSRTPQAAFRGVGGNGVPNLAPFADTPVAVTPTGTSPVIFATQVPTVTPLPSVLEVRGSLAYVVRENGQTDLWAVAVGTETQLRLTNDPADERDPVWSPDGRRLAYASRQDGNWEIYITDFSDSANPITTRMTVDLSFQGGPAWSPDGAWLAHESYQGNNLDIYALSVDGSLPTQQLTRDPAPDFSPAWSPGGREIAFVSWRDGNQDIYLFSLDDDDDTPRIRNITNTPTRHEDHPTWSPDGELLAYSALDEGIEKVFVLPVNDPNATAQVLERGRQPDWAPDGSSLVSVVDALDGSQLIASPFAGAGVVPSIIPVPRGASDPSWTAAPLPQALVNAGGVGPAVSVPLFIEQVDERNTDPPYRLNPIEVNVENAVLSDRVNDSFNALREAVNAQAGWDVLGRLDDAFWSIERPPQPGEDIRSWLKTGRAFGLTRNSILGFPPPMEIVREDIGINTYWRVFVRVVEDAQSGQLGEPLRHMPWDIASRTAGDVEAYDQGGRLRAVMPQGYYIDLTQIIADYGWQRMPAGRDWRANANSINYWLFRKPDGLDWYNAMRELYTEGQMGGFVPTATLTPVLPPTEPATVDPGELPQIQPTNPPTQAPTVPPAPPTDPPTILPTIPEGLLPPDAEALLTPLPLEPQNPLES
ncbi:MAG: hypothetical protein GYB67_17595 [Chloroflexi bacterium]|nr:hypothetical protein [Chloroflexota bacterium]